MAAASVAAVAYSLCVFLPAWTRIGAARWRRTVTVCPRPSICAEGWIEVTCCSRWLARRPTRRWKYLVALFLTKARVSSGALGGERRVHPRRRGQPARTHEVLRLARRWICRVAHDRSFRAVANTTGAASQAGRRCRAKWPRRDVLLRARPRARDSSGRAPSCRLRFGRPCTCCSASPAPWPSCATLAYVRPSRAQALAIYGADALPRALLPRVARRARRLRAARCQRPGLVSETRVVARQRGGLRVRADPVALEDAVAPLLGVRRRGRQETGQPLHHGRRGLDAGAHDAIERPTTRPIWVQGPFPTPTPRTPPTAIICSSSRRA